MLKILLYVALVQPITGISLKGVLPRRRVFQRKPRQTYQQRKSRRIAAMWDGFDLNHAA